MHPGSGCLPCLILHSFNMLILWNSHVFTFNPALLSDYKTLPHIFCLLKPNLSFKNHRQSHFFVMSSPSLLSYVFLCVPVYLAYSSFFFPYLTQSELLYIHLCKWFYSLNWLLHEGRINSYLSMMLPSQPYPYCGLFFNQCWLSDLFIIIITL